METSYRRTKRRRRRSGKGGKGKGKGRETTWDPRRYFPSEEIHTQDFTFWKNPLTPAGFELVNLGSSGEYDNQLTTRVDRNDKAPAYGLDGFDPVLEKG